MYKDRIAFPQGINTYVPGMQYSSALVHGQPTAFSLGSPAAGSATAILSTVAANAAANTLAAAMYVSDSPFGRNVIFTISGNPGNAHVVDVYGYDYLGQPMVERFTGASGATAVLYGQKAFYRVTNTKIITPSSNAVTFNLGTGTRLGLPYKGEVAWAQEAGLRVPVYNRDLELTQARPAALAAAGGSVFIRSPAPGFIKNVFGYTFGAGSTTDPVITVKLATVTITGLTVTLDANVSTTAAVVTGTPTTAGYNANNRVIKGDVIEIVGAAAASAAGDVVGVTLTPTQFLAPDITDPATRNTGDPTGTYEALATLNGSTSILVGLVGDPSVNASGNGGLHGLRHFYG